MEHSRLEAVRELAILDTEPETEFDELAQLAACLCGTPYSAITLIDEGRQWFKAKIGFEITESAREIAFCDHTIQQDDLLVVEDARRDSRFAKNPFVTGEFGLRFYAGFPVSGRDGHKVGTLCVSDTEPKHLTQDQRATLAVLAHQVSARLELRLHRQTAQRIHAENLTLLAEIRASEELFRTFMHHSPAACFIKDEHGRYIFYNEKVATSAGVSLDACLGRTDLAMWHPSLGHAIRENDRRVLERGELIETCETTSTDSQVTYWRSFRFPCKSSAGRPMLAGISIDITQEHQYANELQRAKADLEEANAHLRQLSLTDPLTGLANRRALSERLMEEAALAAGTGTPLSLLTIDIDRFKQINDRLGHERGDDVLRVLADVISRCLRRTDLAVRYGGEEFTVLLPDRDTLEAFEVADRIQQELAAEPLAMHPVTVSIGIAALLPQQQLPGAASLRSLFERSDRAMYLAKQAGRNRICVDPWPELPETPVRTPAPPQYDVSPAA